jgi:eukaryotic-like serine/threonine-protein kinase
VPNAPEIAPDGAGAPSAMPREELIELRPSARFDSVEGLARLAVLPSDENSRSRAGWTVPIKEEPRRVDRARAAVVLAYAFAFIAAVSIAIFA